MKDMDTFNFLVSEFRSDRLGGFDLNYAVQAWCGMDRGELRATLRPYVAHHARQILAAREHEPTSVLWEKLCGDACQQIGVDSSTAGHALRSPAWPELRTFCGAAGRIEVTLELVHAMPATFHVTASGVTHTVRNLTYTPQWSYDQAVEVGEEIVSGVNFDVAQDAPATTWGWFRALVRTLATADIDWLDGYLHETYEQESYYAAQSSAEHSLVCEVAAALHPNIAYRDFSRRAVDSAESAMINALAAILGEYVETEESDGDIYAHISLGRWNAQDVLNRLTDLAREWGHETVEDAAALARRALCEWSDAERYL